MDGREPVTALVHPQLLADRGRPPEPWSAFDDWNLVRDGQLPGFQWRQPGIPGVAARDVARKYRRGVVAAGP
jgi:hypothetical protein